MSLLHYAGGFTLKNASNGFHSHNTGGLKNAAISDDFGFVFEENSGSGIS